MLLAVVVGGQRGRPQQVDRAVRADQAAAGEGRRGRHGDHEQCGCDGARQAGGGSADRADHRRSPLDGRSGRTGPVGAQDSGTPPRCSRPSGPGGVVAPSRGGTRRLDRPSWADARTPPATRPRAAPGPRPAPRLGPVRRRLRRPWPPPTSRRRTRGTTPTRRWSPRSRPPRPRYPDIVSIRSIGKSYQHRDLWVAKVSDNVATDEAEPEVMFDSLHHAREHLSLEQNLALLRWLTDRLRHGRAGSPASSTPARSGSCSRSTPTAPSTT